MIKILGSHGNRSSEFNTTCIQVSKHTVIDAGNIVDGLKENAREINNIFLSHSHLDHIVDCAFLCDNFFSDREEPIKIFALKETIEVLKENFFNWKLWPDFTTLKLERSDKMALEFVEIKYDIPVQVDDVLLTPFKSNHTVPCCGYVIEKNKNAILFSGDTYKNDRLWEVVNENTNIKALIIDVSFPSSMNQIAKQSKHLTPSLLEEELKKLKRVDVEIYINHIKSNFRKIIEKEIAKIGLDSRNILCGGEKIYFQDHN